MPRAQKIRYENLRDALLADYAVNGRKWLRMGKEAKPYLSGVAALNIFFKNFRAVNVTADSLSEFIRDQQESGAANGTINRSLALLRRLFRIALTDGKLREAPHCYRWSAACKAA